jgi:hypothetical protein
VSCKRRIDNEVIDNEIKTDVNYNSYKLNTEKDQILEISSIPQKGTEEYNESKYNESKLPWTTTLKRHSKLERIIFSLLEENKKFSIIDYFKQKCRCRSKRIILYGYALKNLQEILDIKNYLKSHLELNLIKQVLFDEYQLKIFNTISPVIGFKHMFEEDEYIRVNLAEYNKVEFMDFFDFVHHILLRKNLVDNKILDFINKQLVVQS